MQGRAVSERHLAVLLPQAVTQAHDEGLVRRAGHVAGERGQV